jgi:hypothetical protein
LVSIVDLHGLISVGEQRETVTPGYVTRIVTRVALATASSPTVHQASAHRPLARRETRLANRPDYEGEK